MMADEIIKELWEIKDAIAREHGYDLDSLVAHLRRMDETTDHPVVDLHSIKKTAQHAGSGGGEHQ